MQIFSAVHGKLKTDELMSDCGTWGQLRLKGQIQHNLLSELPSVLKQKPDLEIRFCVYKYWY